MTDVKPYIRSVWVVNNRPQHQNDASKNLPGMYELLMWEKS